MKSAFRLLPIHLNYFNSLGFYFEQRYYFDKCLPMECSLSCRYFEAFSSFIEWVVKEISGSPHILLYLDDFLFMGAQESEECMNNLSLFVEICENFGIPIGKR